MFCAMNPDRTVRKSEVSKHCNANGSLVAVVIHQLGLAGFLKTMRGRGGGIRLNYSPTDISVGAVFREFEKKKLLDNTEDTCPLIEHCNLKPLINEALVAFYAVLDKETLADRIAKNSGLADLLRLPQTKPRPSR
ncbi:UNVERIFIED_CONTAM: hypothetical protein GTU68_033593 [Idotea baltica]|nr:hypothetical protein [Idotea baltica]